MPKIKTKSSSVNALTAMNAFHLAARQGHVYQLHSVHVRERTCDLINASDDQGRTALHWSASSGHLQAVTWLLAHGAQVQARDMRQNLPLHLAVAGGYFRVSQQLLKAGTVLEEKDLEQLQRLVVTRLQGLKQSKERYGEAGWRVAIQDLEQMIALLKTVPVATPSFERELEDLLQQLYI